MKKVINLISILLLIIMSISLFSCNSSCGGGTENVKNKSVFEVAKKDGKDILLVDKCQTNYKIVIPDIPTDYETFAADELKTFIDKATGANLEIINSSLTSANGKYIFIGNATKLDNILYEEYGASGSYVNVKGENVYLTGAMGYGVLNAVYRFLHYEISWEAFAFDEIYYEACETLKLLAFDNYKFYTATDYRAVRAGYTYGSSNLYNSARMGNIQTSTTGGSTFEGSLWTSWLHSIQKLLSVSEANRQMELVHGEELDAIVAENLPSALQEKIDEYIRQNSKEPDEEYVKSLTEKLSTDIRSTAAVNNSWTWYVNGQLCLSKDEIVVYFAEVVKKLLLATPSAEFVELGNGDSTTVCDCRYCKEKLKSTKTYGGMAVDFMNRICDILYQDKFFESNPQINPNVRLCFLNYLGYVDAPVDYDENGNVTKVYVKACKNVGTYLCPIYACWNHAVDDPDCVKNKETLKLVKGWSATTDCIGMYLYACNYRDYYTYLDNWAFFRTWGRMMKEYNIKYVEEHTVAEYKASTLAQMRQYLFNKYMMEPECGDFDVLAKDFMNHYYKVASKDMWVYYEEIRQNITAIQFNTDYSCGDCFDDRNEGMQYTDSKWWSWETLNKLGTHIENAYKTIDNSNLSQEEKLKLKNRILVDEMTVRYWKLNKWPDNYTKAEREAETLLFKEWEISVTGA